MYSFTRQDAASILNVSTRSIDRYIKSGKIRTRKSGKIVYLNENDINILKGYTKQEVIVPNNGSFSNYNTPQPTFNNPQNAGFTNNSNNFVNNDNFPNQNQANINSVNNVMNNVNSTPINQANQNSTPVNQVTPQPTITTTYQVQEDITPVPLSNNRPGIAKTALDTVYYDLRNEVTKKDNIIKDLSIELGAAQEVVKNSISLAEFTKTQNLLEESKDELNKEISDLKRERYSLKMELASEKSTNKILIFICASLLIIDVIYWFVKVL